MSSGCRNRANSVKSRFVPTFLSSIHVDAFNLIVGGFLLVVGSAIAIWWWQLARRIAPYQDEAGDAASRRAKDDDAEVIVIQSPTAAPTPTQDRGGPRKAG